MCPLSRPIVTYYDTFVKYLEILVCVKYIKSMYKVHILICRTICYNCIVREIPLQWYLTYDVNVKKGLPMETTELEGDLTTILNELHRLVEETELDTKPSGELSQLCDAVVIILSSMSHIAKCIRAGHELAPIATIQLTGTLNDMRYRLFDMASRIEELLVESVSDRKVEKI